MEQLQAQRDAFWDTAPAYEGKAEVWEALHRLCDCSSLSEAQALANSVPLNFPTGRLLPITSIKSMLFSNSCSTSRYWDHRRGDAFARSRRKFPKGSSGRLEGPRYEDSIRFDTLEDLLAEVSKHDTLAQVRDRILNLRGWTSERPSIRFIYLGKILSPKSTLYLSRSLKIR
ncbi:hypothetical protein L0F63_005935 [Massospora cicadina]|nr:hypothetical protein L0F63_005935 [Massospora cicadina]